ncbi:PKD domain-containing protein [Mucilaginibacter sp.]|uniref:PKD domain-containing protein n=1 Tax=Mucilaginibacter sp. TaxID=1882438 RepID=UPI0035BC7B91
MTLRFLITLLLCFISFCYVCAQGNASNQGKEFWTAYMSHVEDNGASQMSLYITSDVSTNGNVEISDGSFSQPFTVEAKKVTIVNIPHSAFIKSAGAFMRGIHITAQKNIAVYAHIYAQNVSGATLLLPVAVLGKNYTSINYTQFSNSRNSFSTLAVIGVEDNTTVEITPSVVLNNGRPAGEKFQITLQKGEVYQALATADLTNTQVRSVSTAAGECKKIAVFSGSSKIAIYCNPGSISSDNLFQQVYPTSSWGKNYLTAPLKSRIRDIFRIVMSDPNTTVTLNGNVVVSGAASNSIYEFQSDIPNTITADKPIQVVQYAVSQGNSLGDDCIVDPADIGDPEMIYLSPLEQTLDHVTLYSTDAFAITNNFINVVIKTSMAPSFELDGRLYNTLTNDPSHSPFKPIPGNADYSYAQIPVGAGTHYINAADGFNAIAYGFGQHESYGYAAGASIKNLDQNIVIADRVSNKISTTGCAGVAYKLQLTIPYQTTNIKWDFKDGTTPYIDSNPLVVATTQRDGKALFLYEYYKPVTFTSGDYSITGTVRNPTSDDCGSDVPIDLDFSISDFPVAKFSNAGNCAGDGVIFTDETTPGENVKTWLWDFGDGQTSADKRPAHIYATGGSYSVKLTVTNEGGCSSSAQLAVVIKQKPKAAFMLPAPYCFGKDITLTDQSTSTEGAITQWIWDFGDGTPVETRTDKTPFKHAFNKVGPVTVQLKVVTDNGCSDISKQVIDIKTAPVVDFTLPDVCLSDAVALFTDKSTISDNSEGSFTYLWNFGDNNANAANPNFSTFKNPGHKYTRTDNYTVTLTITSASGCAITKSQTLTVNGDIPAAIFSVDNKDNLCSASPVVFRDKSTVNFGNVTKVVWYYDYLSKPGVKETYIRADIPSDRTYIHNYDVFNAPLTRRFTVRMEAYSGETCVDVTQQEITVNANPLVRMSPIGTVCFGAAPFQILADQNGFTGTGSFSGRGVSATGTFTANRAGAGLTTISYTFTATNGCSYTTTQDITVLPELVADAAEDVTILEGTSATLTASANQSGVRYKWYPSTGLDHDDIASPTASPMEDITYKLVVTNADGCTDEDEIFVHVLKKPVVNNTFTPNGDGVNDIWNIKYLETYPGNTVDIYNRQGEKVYSSVGYAIPWDGRFRGTDLPAGTYYYIINPKNGRKVISGNVTIIR